MSGFFFLKHYKGKKKEKIQKNKVTKTCRKEKIAKKTSTNKETDKKK